MRILIRTSKWAIWSRRFGSFALPLLVIPIWMHRNQMLPSETFHTILAVAVGIALLAVFLGLGAYVRLWQTGDRGWGRATLGLFLGLLCLSPFAYGISLAMRYPAISDISTKASPPLRLMVKPQEVPPVPAPSPEEILGAFPNAVSRTYKLNSNQVFKLVEELVGARGWEIRARSAPASIRSDGQINAMATTFFGWRDEVVVRIGQIGTGTRVDMRSTSLIGAHDLGRNGTRIESFLLELDELVSEKNREEVVLDDPHEEPTGQ
ncbi:MAG TPA: DUF1499 domain-containing protein [Devosia sp.]|nr:DUF1499 domain-containing protein [Devosia sp.]